MKDILIVCYVLWNLAVLLIYGLDKRRAVREKWRIRERTLLICAFAMGGLGALLGMELFRHKTQHIKFKILVPLALVCNAAAVLGGMVIAQRYLQAF